MSFVAGPLPEVAELHYAEAILQSYEATDEPQREARERMLAFTAEHSSDGHRRTCLEGHLTASSLLVDAAGERALLTLHRKLGRWLQLGGHCDGDANLPGVALREAIEESGVGEVEIELAPIDLDIHAIPARPGEPRHLHLDTRFLCRAGEGALPRASDESIELRWFAEHELDSVDVDESVRRLFRIAFGG